MFDLVNMLADVSGDTQRPSFGSISTWPSQCLTHRGMACFLCDHPYTLLSCAAGVAWSTCRQTSWAGAQQPTLGLNSTSHSMQQHNLAQQAQTHTQVQMQMHTLF
jgi:hypothetical protein